MGRSIKTRQHVQIIDIADEGRAIGKTPEGEVLLVEGALPGAVVDVQIFRKKKGLAMARTERIIEPSPWQQDPFCAHFGHCGGCKWQHLDYAQQLKFKENNVREALRRMKAGTPLILFPEGTRGYSERPKEPQPGVGFLTRKSGLPVVPARIEGSDKALPPGAKWFKSHQVKVVFGRPIAFRPEEDYPAVAQRILEAIYALKV